MKGDGLKELEIKTDENWFTIIFPRKEEVKDRETKGEGVSEGVKQLLAYIRKNPGKRTSQISQELKVPIKTLERWIKKLREKEYIEYIGSSKTGGYYAKETK